MTKPPPIPGNSQGPPRWKLRPLVVGASVLVAGFISLFWLLLGAQSAGLIRPFSIPISSMSPAINAGDCILTERLTYLARPPSRGDLLVFKTDDIPAILEHSVYVKRLVGLPGDELCLKDGALLVNGQPVSLRNRDGEIHYRPMAMGRYFTREGETVRVPPKRYFVLGDNPDHSADSRLWGFVPMAAVIGCAAICYWPPGRIGAIQ